jgi:hypothetical protein
MSLNSRFKASTEIDISCREMPNEPNIKIRLPTPRACIFLINMVRFLRMAIWPLITSSGFYLYWACRALMREPRVRNLLV